ncbi:hypothetical protein HMPREF2811_02830 [Globicatella sp. HMSC072A10]|uniref:hypothetical protein n=1 Tax=Globicatella sp. HMSC072A10 TaxID=1739315 RepID=UPI0008D2711A|nr:hypothetical protein [Globicatella sp. HMSC072A10]OFK61736.1 hypothetical protein HMPREF2811_02830 [Globicatella sp. HMSC072A10]
MTKKIKEDPVLLAIAVLNHNEGVRFVNEAIKLGLNGGVISPATGLIGSPLLNLLSIRHDRRDFVMIFERESVLIPALKSLVDTFKMHLPNHGIVFVLKTGFQLSRDFLLENNNWNETEADYQLMVLSFKHGRATEIVQKINQVSTAGATIFTGKGESVLERQQMMGLVFAPQKDVILSVVESEQVPDVFMVMENSYGCTQTKGMSVLSIDIHNFSRNRSLTPMKTDSEREILISIVSEELEEEYIKIMKKHRMNGGTSLKGHGSVSPEMMEKIFNITVNPQKKILFTIDTTKKIEAAYHDILLSPKMNEAHKGVYLTIPVHGVYGLYQED